jgi:hypothetical protein
MFNWYFASGDLGFFWGEQIRIFSWLPEVFYREYGFGYPALLSLWLNYPFRLFVKLLFSLGLSWFLIEKILWFGVFGLCIYSSYQLAQLILKKSHFSWISSVIYTANTYFLLLFGGGQLGVALAYAFAPLVLLKFIQVLDASSSKFIFRWHIINGLLLALLITFDLRLAYITLVAIGLYSLVRIRNIQKTSLISVLVAFLSIFIPLAVAGVLHLFWILPTVLASQGTSSLGEQFTSVDMLKFLSFADFSHSMSLLHPNWPENLFGRIHFLRPEFILIPIMAFAALVQGKKKMPIHIVFFAGISMLGAFLSKGVNEPLGVLFSWMFEHVPGFVMFRDPTKFYLLTALGYSILIAYTLQNISKTFWRKIAVCTFIVFWIFSLRAVFLGQVKGNFSPSVIPGEYMALREMLVHEKEPSRTVWIPHWDNYAFKSEVHPIFSSDQLFENASLSAIMTMAQTPEFKDKLNKAGVKYVIVPIDIDKRMFLNDYVFDETMRDSLVESLDKSHLKRNPSFTDVAVYENSDFSFEQQTPTIISRQNYWANIGAAISGIGLIIFVCMLLF